ncbi:Uncharacterized protein Rs2_02831 [Raphanus sativus]|nr:Uncharacterized protein Rs2_02831 [Raphanus sativus]
MATAMKSTGKPPVVVSLVTSQKNQPKLISVISVNPFLGGKKHSKRHDLYWVETPPIRRTCLNKHVLASSQSRNNLQPSEFSGYQKQGDLTKRFRFLSHDDIQGLRGDIYGFFWLQLTTNLPVDVVGYLKPVNEQSLIDCSVEDEVEIATRVVLLVYLQSKEGPVMKN